MKCVFVSYNRSLDFDQPADWIRRIKAYVIILEELAKKNEVISIERINYHGIHVYNNVKYIFMDSGGHHRTNSLIKSIQPDIIIVHGLHQPFNILLLRFKVGKKPLIIGQNHAEKPYSGLKK